MRIELVRAWPRRHEIAELVLPDGAIVADALAAADADVTEIDGYAVFGVRVKIDTPLRDGDRLELLRPLQADPKEARRRRAQQTPRRL
ncbi:MAG: RnfH family protein [Luteimonas sp.]